MIVVKFNIKGEHCLIVYGKNEFCLVNFVLQIKRKNLSFVTGLMLDNKQQRRLKKRTLCVCNYKC